MKRALVTGASGAIGAAIARKLARTGLYVYLHGHRHADSLEALAGEIREAGGECECISFDVADHETSQSALQGVLQSGPVQVLVNNAGIHDDAPLAGMNWTQWERVTAVCLHGFFNVTQPLLLPMIGTRWGRIINVSSIAAVIGNRGQTNYAAAKAGLIGATKSLAIEVASRGITVNAIAPGIIASPSADAAFPAERIAALVPMKRAGTADEVASLAGYLASEEAAYISGQLISINGAMA